MSFPTEAEETVLDTVSLDDFLIDNKAASYMLRVRGESMMDAGILDGDLVIVERTGKAAVGDIVIAAVDGRFTMKYLRKKDGAHFLEAANPKFLPVYPREGLVVEAVVRAVVRKYS